MITYLQFFDPKPGSVEAVVFKFFDFLVTQDVHHQMVEIQVADGVARREVFCREYPWKAFVINYHNMIGLFMLSILMLWGLVFKGFDTLGESIVTKLITVVCVGLAIAPKILSDQFQLDFQSRGWVKTKVNSLQSFDEGEFKDITQDGRFALYLYTHPGSSEKFLSVVGIGDSGEEVEYFLLEIHR